MDNSSLWQSQNFIHSNLLVSKIINLSNIGYKDTVIEIGPGKGIITKHLAGNCSKVLAIECDNNLYDDLKKEFANNQRVELVYGDFLAYELPDYPYKIFSNIPFNVTSNIVKKITMNSHVPTDAYLIMQEEAAKKNAGQPYCKESLKSLIAKPIFQTSILYKFKNTDFIPIPQADIVLLHIQKRDQPILTQYEYENYRDFLCFVFSQHGINISERMKKIFSKIQLTRLSKEYKFQVTNRPIDLSFEQWLNIFKYYLSGVSAKKKQIILGAENRLLKQQNKLTKIHRNRRVKDYTKNNCKNRNN